MGSYQFAHIECYSRSAGKGKTGGQTINDIAGEAERIDGYCPHIPHPSPPIIWPGGVTATEAAKEASKWADSAKDASGRRLRKDGICLLVGVISCPAEQTDQWPSLKHDSIAWLIKQYGDRLKSVVEHTDEEYPHIHFFVVPRPNERIDDIHAGRKASASIKATGESKTAQRAAYSTAMKEWQDSFYHNVGMLFGLTRFGPRRQRLTRKEWKAQKSVADLLACELNNLENKHHELEQKKAKLATDTERLEQKKYDKELISSALAEQLDVVEKQSTWRRIEITLNQPSANISPAAAKQRIEFSQRWQKTMEDKSLRVRIIRANPQTAEKYKKLMVAGDSTSKITNDNRLNKLRSKLGKLKLHEIFERKRLTKEIEKEQKRQNQSKKLLNKLRREHKELLQSVPETEIKILRNQLEAKRLKAVLVLLAKEKEEAREKKKPPTNGQNQNNSPHSADNSTKEIKKTKPATAPRPPSP